MRSRNREPDPPEALVERQRLKLQSVPLLIAIGAKIDPDGHIPKIEQLLSVGAAAMNMLNAIHALGYGGIWVTGPMSMTAASIRRSGFPGPTASRASSSSAPRKARRARCGGRLLADHLSEWTGTKEVARERD